MNGHSDILIIGGGIPEMKDFPKEQFERELTASVGKMYCLMDLT